MNDDLHQECEATGNTSPKKEPVPSNATTKLVGIYGLRNKISGKWYVGQSVNIAKRWNDYKNHRCRRQPKLYNALKKYGFEAFDKVLIETCNRVTWILDYREMYWIRVLNSFRSGYNSTEGGRGSLGRAVSEDTRKLIGNKSKLRRHTPETIEKIREARTLQPPTPMRLEHLERLRILSKTRIVSEKTKEKMRLSHLGKTHSEETKRKMSETRQLLSLSR